MITKNQIKFVRSLHLKKNRDVHNCFVVEGEKIVNEILESNYNIKICFATRDWKNSLIDAKEVQLVSEKELERISSLKSPNKVIAIVEKPNRNLEKLSVDRGFTLLLDDIKNPGNLGTIIRICDWFGVKNIICSDLSVDLFNPKVIQATMGSLLRVDVYYSDIEEVIKNLPQDFPVYGSFVDGESENIVDLELEDDAVLVMGNESFGISNNLINLINKKVTIKSENSKSESLNVAIATAILLYEFKRKH